MDDTTPDRIAASDRTSGVVVAVGGGAALVAAALISPSGVESGPILCPFRLMTGIPCPACGLTRSWVHLAHGDLATSVSSHPVGPALMLLTLVATVAAVVYVVSRRWLVTPRLLLSALVVLGLATGVFGVWRWITLV